MKKTDTTIKNRKNIKVFYYKDEGEIFFCLRILGRMRSSFFLRMKRYFSKTLACVNFICKFASDLQEGALAHLARAFDWQSKGDEFESRMLHRFNEYVN